MSMSALSPLLRRHALDAMELTMAERLTLAWDIGGSRVQDLVVALGITRSEAKRLLKLRDQLGRSLSPCMLAMIAATAG